MTKLAAEAWRQPQELEDTEQDRLAQIILDDIESERRWDELFAKSEDMLEEMGEAAWQDHLGGKTTPLDPGLLWGPGKSGTSTGSLRGFLSKSERKR